MGEHRAGPIVFPQRDVQHDTPQAVRTPKAWVELGATLARGGQHRAAERAFAIAVSLAPEDPRCQMNFGVALVRSGQPQAALRAYQRALFLAPDMIAAATGISGILRRAGCDADAVGVHRRQVAWAPASAATLNGLALAEHNGGDPAVGERLYRAALRADPTHTDARLNLAMLLQSSNRVPEAFLLYRDAIAAGFASPAMYVNMGAIEQHSGRAAQAILLYRGALERDPDNLDAHINIAAALLELGRPQEAILHCQAALRRQPNTPETLWNLSCAHLMLGDRDAGFLHYDVRWTHPQPELRQQHFPYPLWNGKPLGSGTLLLWGEHGVGDEILYASLLPEALAHTDSVVVECDPRLEPLFARSFPAARVVARSTPPHPATTTGIAAQSSTLRLPALFRDSPASRGGAGYLRADQALAERACADLARLGAGPKVGIAWTSGNRQTAGRKATSLEQWRPILAMNDVQFVSLQYGDVGAEIDTLRAAGMRNLHHNPNPDLLSDLDGLAAQIAGLDLVISIAGLTAHLAGALGQPCWALLPPGPLWFWGLSGETVPWYPSLRLFRKDEADDWSPCLASAAAALADWRTP